MQGWRNLRHPSQLTYSMLVHQVVLLIVTAMQPLPEANLEPCEPNLELRLV